MELTNSGWDKLFNEEVKDRFYVVRSLVAGLAVSDNVKIAEACKEKKKQ
jgi:hypothetical protein